MEARAFSSGEKSSGVDESGPSSIKNYYKTTFLTKSRVKTEEKMGTVMMEQAVEDIKDDNLDNDEDKHETRNLMDGKTSLNKRAFPLKTQTLKRDRSSKSESHSSHRDGFVSSKRSHDRKKKGRESECGGTREGRYHPIMGYRVSFPAEKKPFPAQLAVMSKILTALHRRQNALLESPTGSGKTLALLCSSLAFQQEEARRLRNEYEQIEAKKLEERKQVLEQMKTKKQERKEIKSDNNKRMINVESNVNDDDDDFIEDAKDSFSFENRFDMYKSLKSYASNDVESKRKLPESFYNGVSGDPSLKVPPSVQMEECADKSPKITLESYMEDHLPVIFFATRTHSQLSQVVGELKRCPRDIEAFEVPGISNGLQMTILGSRKQYCLNPKVKNSLNMNEECKNLLRHSKKNCKFEPPNAPIIRNIFDIEDLIEAGTDQRKCPYFAAREGAAGAHIIFCPYNYILDKKIRTAMQINLDNAIVLFDEAHNIEDVCREAASIELTHEDLLDALNELNGTLRNFPHGLQFNDTKLGLSYFQSIIQGLVDYLQFIKESKNPRDLERESSILSGPQASAVLKEYCDIDVVSVCAMTKHYEILSGADEIVELAPASLAMMESIVIVTEYMFRDRMKHLDSFKMLVQKSQPAFSRATAPTWSYRLCLWCMSPAVAFADVAQKTRSIVLTSGTLSPMDSFAGELAVDFPVRLEANHVIDTSKQLWIGSVLCGPANIDLKGVYQNQQSLPYQDSLGQSLLQYAKVIPGGILMFVPSYSLMNKLQSRWEDTGVWEDIGRYKTIYLEPRKAGTEFDECLQEYRNTIAKNIPNYTSRSNEKLTGSIMIAVFRGKVSEGIDFADDDARAVLVVGIPYPNVRDLKVLTKKKYQDRQSVSRGGILNGATWYSHQAFRALNQAIGRCIRHRNDFGAIVLLDPRYANSVSLGQLSKWTRGSVRQYPAVGDTLPDLRSFFARLCLGTSTNGFSTEETLKQSAAVLVLNISAAKANPEAIKAEIG